jgi:excisionase family DNA binding protein
LLALKWAAVITVSMLVRRWLEQFVGRGWLVESIMNGGTNAQEASSSRALASDPATPRLSSFARSGARRARSVMSGELAQSTQTSPDRLLDVREAAEMLGLKPSTLCRWAYERRIPVVKLFGRALRFRMSDLQELVTGSRTSRA